MKNRVSGTDFVVILNSVGIDCSTWIFIHLDLSGLVHLIYENHDIVIDALLSRESFKIGEKLYQIIIFLRKIQAKNVCQK